LIVNRRSARSRRADVACRDPSTDHGDFPPQRTATVSILLTARHRAVFLDRDGVINRALVRDRRPYAPRHLNEFRLLPGVAQAVTQLKSAGFLIIVVTNQPDVGHGLTTPQTLAAMHARLGERLPVDAILVCPHRRDAGCACRKPKPGMIHQAESDWGIDVKRSYLVGDRSTDILAGRAAGLYTIFLDRGYAEPLLEPPDARVGSLRQAVRKILSRETSTEATHGAFEHLARLGGRRGHGRSRA
jgi:D-glycero-D-manno-heptose 1,7-bisphosphate phosphatase